MKGMMIFLCLLSVFSISAKDDVSKYPLRGQGEYKWFLLSVYDAKLWAPEGPDLYSKPLDLELKYKRNFTGADIVKQSEKELASAGVERALIEKWRAKLLEIFPDVKDGDAILASYVPETGITFYLNSNKLLGVLSDKEFSKTFLNIWLGEKTTAPDLRAKLLGNK